MCSSLHFEGGGGEGGKIHFLFFWQQIASNLRELMGFILLLLLLLLLFMSEKQVNLVKHSITTNWLILFIKPHNVRMLVD
jgi:hypothetical protein